MLALGLAFDHLREMAVNHPDDVEPRREHFAATSLIVVGTSKTPLSKAQQSFNRLIKKIEKLHQSIRDESDRLNELMVFYTLKLHPLKMQICQERKNLVRELSPFLKSREISGRKRREALEHIICMQLEWIFDMEGELKDVDLQAIAEKIEEKKAKRYAKNESPEDLIEILGGFFSQEFEQERLRSMGVDVDLSKKPSEMSPVELEAFLAYEEFCTQEDERLHSESVPKAKKSPEEEIQQRDLGNLYKQLAKLLHPDLEQDPSLRLEKEESMKLLTIAYKNRDLHALLRLEMEWIYRQKANVVQFTEEKLRGYNRLLKDQVEELQAQVREVSQHPRFEPLTKYCSPASGFDQLHPNFMIKKTEEELASIRWILQEVQGENRLQRIRDLIIQSLSPRGSSWA